MRVLVLALKDLRQIGRDKKAAFFLLVMPLVFTLLFGFAFGGTSGPGNGGDPRLPVGLMDLDDGPLGQHMVDLLDRSAVVRPVTFDGPVSALEEAISEGELAAAVVVPAGFSQLGLHGEFLSLQVIADPASTAGLTVQGEIQRAARRLALAIRSVDLSARILEGERGFTGQEEENRFRQASLDRALAAWRVSPLQVESIAASARTAEDLGSYNAFAQSSPGMMAQFAIAGLLVASGILVVERKSGALRRLLTTDMHRVEILFGHYLAMFLMVLLQMVLLVIFGQLFLRLDYLHAPVATGLLVVASAAFSASLGLLIGALARTEDQVTIFSLVLMFLLAGLGGAWVPLEVTSADFQKLAFFTPVAWIMDGFKDIILRGLGLEAVLTGLGVLLLYTLAVFGLAVWRFQFE